MVAWPPQTASCAWPRSAARPRPRPSASCQEKTRGPAGTRHGAAQQEAGRSAEHDAPVKNKALADLGGSGVGGGSVLGRAGLEVTGRQDLPAKLAEHLEGSASVQAGWCHALDEHGLPVPHERLLDNAYRRYNKARRAPCWDSSSDVQTWAACGDALLHVFAWHCIAASSNAQFIMSCNFLSCC